MFLKKALWVDVGCVFLALSALQTAMNCVSYLSEDKQGVGLGMGRSGTSGWAGLSLIYIPASFHLV